MEITESIFKKKQENEIIWMELVNLLNFSNKKVVFIAFNMKDVNKLLPYYQQLTPVFWEISLTKKVTC